MDKNIEKLMKYKDDARLQLIISKTLKDYEYGAHPDHATKSVYCPFENKHINIDIEISDLVEAIWKAGIETVESCQEGLSENHIYLVFYDADFAKFMQLIKNNEQWEDDKGWINRKMYDITSGDKYDDNSWKYFKTTSYITSVSFPKDYYDFVMKKMITTN